MRVSNYLGWDATIDCRANGAVAHSSHVRFECGNLFCLCFDDFFEPIKPVFMLLELGGLFNERILDRAQSLLSFFAHF